MDILYLPDQDRLDYNLYTFDVITSFIEYFGTYDEYNWQVFSTPLTIKALQSATMIQNTDVADILRDVLECMADTAYIMQTSVEGRQEKQKPKQVPTWSIGSLTYDEEGQLQKMIFELNRRINKHQILIKDIRRTQKKIWDREQNHERRNAILNDMTRKLQMSTSNNDPKNSNDATHHTRLRTHKEKSNSARKLLQKSQTKLQQMLEKEKSFRTDILTLESEIREFITKKVVTKVEKCLVNMAVAVMKSESSKCLYKNIITKLSKINPAQIASAFYERSSRKYTFPLIEEFIKNTGFTSKIPEGQITEHEGNLRGQSKKNGAKLRKYLGWQSHKHAPDSEFLLDEEESESGDETFCVNLDNGFYVRAKCKATLSKGINRSGFLDISSDQKIKQKMSLMDGQIGFGWTKKNWMACKKWGFFEISKVCYDSCGH